MQIIRDRRVVEDSYRHLPDEDPLPVSGDVFVSLGRWIRDRPDLICHRGHVGLRVTADVDLDALVPHLPGVPALAVVVAKFTDGRCYSTARLLRERYGYLGRLRAVGHVLRDQLAYLERCGFDSFELAGGKSLEAAIDAFRDITVVYQGAADRAPPSWRRRGGRAWPVEDGEARR